ncbi:MAG TPA: uroporphyrinogen-III synthase, partial [Candidatus Polarisedimenticolia bacterium]|nr:uroporphyrinogen-III synthase [Candidatus Polarisedimenticolia bacterium]
ASELGAAPRVTARDSRGEGLAASLERRGPVAGLRMLLPRAEAAREALPEALRALGAVVDVVAVYRTVQRPLSPEARRLLREGRVDAVILTSGSTVEALVEDLGGIDLLRGTALAVIGPVTAEALRRRGLEPAVQAARAEASALAEALRAHFAGEGG